MLALFQSLRKASAQKASAMASEPNPPSSSPARRLTAKSKHATLPRSSSSAASIGDTGSPGAEEEVDELATEDGEDMVVEEEDVKPKRQQRVPVVVVVAQPVERRNKGKEVEAKKVVEEESAAGVRAGRVGVKRVGGSTGGGTQAANAPSKKQKVDGKAKQTYAKCAPGVMQAQKSKSRRAGNTSQEVYERIYEQRSESGDEEDDETEDEMEDASTEAGETVEGNEEDEEPEPAPAKRGRGRPRKTASPSVAKVDAAPKRGRGRSPKVKVDTDASESGSNYEESSSRRSSRSSAPQPKKVKQEVPRKKLVKVKDVLPTVTAALRRKLEDPSPAFATAFASGLIKDKLVVPETSFKVPKGSVVSIDDGEGGTWMGVVDSIKGLNSDITIARDEKGEPVLNKKNKPKKECKWLWIRTKWLYSVDDFRSAPVDNEQRQRYQKQLKYLGTNERVSTDHGDWFLQSDLVNLEKPPTVYTFDDQYPAGVSPSTHPLSAFGTSNDLKPKPMPAFLFGDREDDLHYVRTKFRFTGDVAEKDDDEVDDPLPTDPLELSLHSISQTPYDPSKEQRYSHAANKWFNVSELLALKHYASPEAIHLREDFEPAEGHVDVAPREWRVDELLKSSHPAPLYPVAYAQLLMERLPATEIVRGGIYGLTGNVFIVQKLLPPSNRDRYTATLRSMIRQEGSDDSKEAPQEEEGLVELETFIESAAAWVLGVEERRGKAKGVVGRTGGLPEGMIWVCPESGLRI